MRSKAKRDAPKSKKDKSEPGKKNPKRAKLNVNEEDISSDEEDLFNDKKNARYKEHSDDDYEDVQTKAYREAKELLEKIKGGDEDAPTDDEDNEAISHRLIRDVQEKKGLLHRKIAEKVVVDNDSTLTYRPHRFSPITIAVSRDSRYIVSCGKDGSVVKYDLKENKKVGTIKNSKDVKNDHRGHILAIAISPDDRYLVTGGIDKVIKVWKFDTLEFFKNLGDHRAPITSLVFRQSSVLEMFSGSMDRTIKVWNLDQMGFVDVMFGHQDGVCQLDMLSKPRVLSCGGQDRTVRIFKVMEESQLVFNGFNDCISIDTVAFIDEDHFVSGAADGSVCVWGVSRKKPLTSLKQAHGCDPQTGEARWITSVAAVHNTDLIVSGSSDGFLKFYRVSPDYKSLTIIKEVELKGFINGLKFIENGKKLVCAVGQEHKNGRWWKVNDAKNSVVVIPLTFDD